MIQRALDFRRLKQTVSIEQVLSDEGLLDRFHRRGSRLVGPCPLHGGDNPTAFTVDLDRKIWHCFTGCNGGDLVELARRLSDGTFAGAARYLARIEGTAPVPAPFTALHYEPQAFRPFTRRLLLDPAAAFLASKGITPQTARRYEVGAYRGPGMLSGCIGLRLLDVDGNPLGYAGRRLDPLQISSRGKWVFPPRLPKSTLLYGYHQARPLLHAGAVVVECPWGAIRVSQISIPAVALLGTSVSPHQAALLANLPKVVLLLDGDRAGRRATPRITAQLTNATPAHLPDELDPDDLSDQELRHVIAQASTLPF